MGTNSPSSKTRTRGNKDVRNTLAKTAYDVVAENGHTRIFDALRFGDSLCIAARKGGVRTLQRLLESGAAINGRDQHGWTALHIASFKGRIDAVRVLVEEGVDVDAKDEDGYTALHCAAESLHNSEEGHFRPIPSVISSTLSRNHIKPSLHLHF